MTGTAASIGVRAIFSFYCLTEAQDVPHARLLRGLDVSLIFQVVASHYAVDAAALRQRRRHTKLRSLARWLAKRHTSARFSELAEPLGLGGPPSVGNLTRRVELALPTSRKLGRTIKQLEQQLIRRQDELQAATGRHKKKEKLDLTPEIHAEAAEMATPCDASRA